MSTDTTAAPPAPPAGPPPDVVDRLLALPAEDRLELADLLVDSVRRGYTSLAEAAQRDKELIRSRLDQLVKGEVELLDADEVFRRVQARLAEVRKK